MQDMTNGIKELALWFLPSEHCTHLPHLMGPQARSPGGFSVTL